MDIRLYTREEIKDLIAEAIADLASDFASDEDCSGGMIMATMAIGSHIMGRVDELIEEKMQKIKKDIQRKEL